MDALLITNPAYRDKVERLERSIPPEVRLELPVTHYHTTNGLYGRSLLIPKGVVATGKIHKHPHLAVLLEGEVTVLLEHGVERITAPFVCASPAGVKRAVYAHKDSIWFTAHRVEADTVEDIEHELVVSTYEEYLTYVEQLRLKEMGQ